MTSAAGTRTGKLAAWWGVFSRARTCLPWRSQPQAGETPDLSNLPSQGPRLPSARSLQGACA